MSAENSAPFAEESLPLPTLLSFALVAYTIEFDNEFERRLIEPTGKTFKTWKAEQADIFLVSLTMWANYMRFLPADGLSVAQLAPLVGDDETLIKSRVKTLQRWRYVVVTASGSAAPAASAPKKRRQGPAFRDWIVRRTPAGQRCQAVWSSLPDLIERRWRERFGAAAIDRLRAALAAVLAAHEVSLPLGLPVISSRREMFSRVENLASTPSHTPMEHEQLPTFALLARTLLAFTLAFERGFQLALPVCANVLRILTNEALPLRDLPARAGVSKPGMAQGLTLLGRHGLAVTEQRANRQGPTVRLTDAGQRARANYIDQVRSLEADWAERFGAPAIVELRRTLRHIVGDGDPAVAPLSLCLRPAPCNWRAAEPPQPVLPHHPFVLDRGAWPDAA